MGQLLSVVLQYTYFSQRCINTFHYRCLDVTLPVTGTAYALADAMGAIPVSGVYTITKLMWAIAKAVSTSVSFDQIICKNLYNPNDFFETAFSTALNGQVTGEPLSPAVALGYKTTRVRSDIKRGTRRFVGVSEGSSSNGGALLGSYASGVVADLATAMSATITGNTPLAEAEQFVPVIVSKQQYIPDPDHPEKVAYKYYDTEAEQMMHVAEGFTWFAYDQTRTQISRQYGRGQ